MENCQRTVSYKKKPPECLLNCICTAIHPSNRVVGGVPAVGPALNEAGGAAEGALRREDQGREREEGGDAPPQERKVIS